jgi:hypothetical protein
MGEVERYIDEPVTGYLHRFFNSEYRGKCLSSKNVVCLVPVYVERFGVLCNVL